MEVGDLKPASSASTLCTEDIVVGVMNDLSLPPGDEAGGLTGFLLVLLLFSMQGSK